MYQPHFSANDHACLCTQWSKGTVPRQCGTSACLYQAVCRVPQIICGAAAHAKTCTKHSLTDANHADGCRRDFCCYTGTVPLKLCLATISPPLLLLLSNPPVPGFVHLAVYHRHLAHQLSCCKTALSLVICLIYISLCLAYTAPFLQLLLNSAQLTVVSISFIFSI